MRPPAPVTRLKTSRPSASPMLDCARRSTILCRQARRPSRLKVALAHRFFFDRNFGPTRASCLVKAMAMTKTDARYDPPALVVRAQGGSREAMEDLIVLYQERVAGFVYSMIRSEER